MSEEKTYHRERERQCREMAEKAKDPEVRRRHEELAEMHHVQLAPEGAEAQQSAAA